MVHSRIIEQVIADCRCKNDNAFHLGFLITSPYPFLFFVSGLYLSNHLKYFNDTVELQWLEHLWDHENKLETGVVRANEG